MASAGSYEWLRDEVSAAIRSVRPGLDFWIVETFPDSVVIQVWPENQYYRIAYSIAEADGIQKVTMADWKEIQQAWSDVTKEIRMIVPVKKEAVCRRITYGVVSEPDIEDLQGDVYKAEDIELMAHRWMINSRVIGTGHTDVIKSAYPVESYIAPVDFTVDTADGPVTIKKGSWVVATIWPEEQWEQIQKGEINAYSIGGRGVRTPMEEAA